MNIDNDNIFDKLILKKVTSNNNSDFGIDRLLSNIDNLKYIYIYLESFEIYNKQIKNLS